MSAAPNPITPDLIWVIACQSGRVNEQLRVVARKGSGALAWVHGVFHPVKPIGFADRKKESYRFRLKIPGGIMNRVAITRGSSLLSHSPDTIPLSCRGVLLRRSCLLCRAPQVVHLGASAQSALPLERAWRSSIGMRTRALPVALARSESGVRRGSCDPCSLASTANGCARAVGGSSRRRCCNSQKSY